MIVEDDSAKDNHHRNTRNVTMDVVGRSFESLDEITLQSPQNDEQADDLNSNHDIQQQVNNNPYDWNYFKNRLKIMGISLLFFLIVNVLLLMVLYFSIPRCIVLGFDLHLDTLIWYFCLLIEGFFYVSNVTEERCLRKLRQQISSCCSEEEQEQECAPSPPSFQQVHHELKHFTMMEMTLRDYMKHFFQQLFKAFRMKDFSQFSDYYLQDREGTIKELLNLLSPRCFKLLEDSSKNGISTSFGSNLFIYFPLFLVSIVHCLETNTQSTLFEYLLCNGLFGVAFYIGLQFTYLDKIEPLQKFGDTIVNSTRWKEIAFWEWIGLIMTGLAVITLILLQLFMFFTQLGPHILLSFIIGYLLVVTILAILYLSHFRKTHYLHMHHYFLVALLIPMLRIRNVFLIGVIACGICLGVYCEGITRWGMHGVFIRKRT
ncbi:hypothetical protein C9374_004854 [Naegleria lovaniensis]|uniref:Uncharacterized protein n=1 Tax=Naegleria lovaniensis TaxID=51637 RepID=A0AA88GQY6_NAELO|nr:uncharacterized protein C9374_004854 [Naegleria lovaniensis]KAG2382887.1 hypothetical protein C9374_004854 [Naegleria lovaniensis]